jgi:hypothetical protein
MSIDIRTQGFTGRYAALNSPAGPYPVTLPELINRAITVGGLVDGSPRERSLRRSAIASTVLSSVEEQPTGALAMTALYKHTEATEKAGISFRLGMAFAAVAASRVLGITVLRHIDRGRGGAGRRADLLGFDKQRRWHVVEAKCRTHGVTEALLADAKVQARASADRLAAAGRPVATVCAALADLSQPRIGVLIADPPLRRRDGSRGFSEDVFLRRYYSPVLDLLRLRSAESSGDRRVDRVAIGAWLPGAPAWIGVTRAVYKLISETRPLRASGVLGAVRGPAETQSSLISFAIDGHVLVLAEPAQSQLG